MAQAIIAASERPVTTAAQAAIARGGSGSTAVRLNEIIDLVQSYNPGADADLVRHAYVFSAGVHAGQERRSGEPYLLHPLEVAHILAQMHMDAASIATGLLHDTVEDKLGTTDQVRDEFGDEIAFLVDGVTKLSKMTYTSKEQRQAESFRKMLFAMAEDLRVVIVKLADRLHNMRTLEHMPLHKQQMIAAETMEIYAPLANRLGISWVKSELEDLSFKYLHPGEYEKISSEYQASQEARNRRIEEIRASIERQMQQHGIQFIEVQGRSKHVYSVYRKMTRKNVDFSDIYDLTAFRIIVPEVKDCYEALGVIHAEWTPVPGRFKDYIALPKLNRYQSLHTTVVGRHNEGRIEVQIRTRDMHMIAEEGIAAHWRYKEGGYSGKNAEQFDWLRRMVDNQRDVEDVETSIDAAKVDLFSDEVYVFTPNGDVVELPRGATPIDLAYHIHTELGHNCIGAKVNGVIVPLRTSLKSGVVVEILRGKGGKPSKDWLKSVVTVRARSKIRSFLREEQREKGRTLGMEILEREAGKHGVSLAKLKKGDDLQRIAPKLKAKDGDELLRMIGIGKVEAKAALHELFPDVASLATPGDEAPQKTIFGKIIDRVTKRGGKSQIEVQGMADILTQFARCCSPIPGDPIVGYITRGRGVVIHRKDCARANDYDPERKVEVRWSGMSEGKHSVGVRVVSQNVPGVLAAVSGVFSKHNVNINEANCRTFPDQRAVNDFSGEVENLDQLRKVLVELERLKGVVSAERIAR